MSEWHARFERDAAFRQAVTGAYDGRHDVADALWWLDHPDDTAPSGAPSPMADRANLQRAAFARPADPDVDSASPRSTVGAKTDEPSRADPSASGRDGAGGGGRNREAEALTAQRALAALEVQADGDRRAAQAAVDDALRALGAGQVTRKRGVAVLVGAFVAAVLVAGGATFAITQAMAGAGSAVAGAEGPAGDSGSTADGATGAQNGDAQNGDAQNGDAQNGGAQNGDAQNGDDSSAQGGSSYSATGGASDAGATAPPLEPFPTFLTDLGKDSFGAVFAREQSAADFAPGVLPADLRGETFRVLNIGQNTSGAVYAAVDTNNQVCLVAYGNRETFGVSCATAAVVSARGLQVSLIAADHRDPTTGLLTPAIGLSARWESDGRFTLDTSIPYDRD